MKLIEAFTILGVPPRTPALLVHQAYRRLVRQWHPDQFADQPRLRSEAEGRLKMINLAYAQVKAHLNDQPVAATTQARPGAARPNVSGYPPRFTHARPRFTPPHRVMTAPAVPPIRPATHFHQVLQTADAKPKTFKKPSDIVDTPHNRNRDMSRYPKKRSNTMRVEPVSPVTPVQPVRPVSPIGESD